MTEPQLPPPPPPPASAPSAYPLVAQPPAAPAPAPVGEPVTIYTGSPIASARRGRRPTCAVVGCLAFPVVIVLLSLLSLSLIPNLLGTLMPGQTGGSAEQLSPVRDDLASAISYTNGSLAQLVGLVGEEAREKAGTAARVTEANLEVLIPGGTSECELTEVRTYQAVMGDAAALLRRIEAGTEPTATTAMFEAMDKLDDLAARLRPGFDPCWATTP